MDSHRCRECGVEMEEVRFGMADSWDPYVTTGEKRTGLLGKLGMNEREEVTTAMCPECGELRWFAEFDDEERW